MTSFLILVKGIVYEPMYQKSMSHDAIVESQDCLVSLQRTKQDLRKTPCQDSKNNQYEPQISHSVKIKKRGGGRALFSMEIARAHGLPPLKKNFTDLHHEDAASNPSI